MIHLRAAQQFPRQGQSLGKAPALWLRRAKPGSAYAMTWKPCEGEGGARGVGRVAGREVPRARLRLRDWPLGTRADEGIVFAFLVDGRFGSVTRNHTRITGKHVQLGPNGGR